MSRPELTAALAEREIGMTAWLRENAPDVFTEQKHLDEGTRERAYWHYGYLVAIRDIIKLLSQ